MNVINFYRESDSYGFFSNFFKRKVIIDGKIWLTTEHFFQAMKFAGTKYEEEIRNLKTAREAANSGRDRTKPLRNDWELVKDDIMRIAIRAKFTQNEDLKALLLSTNGSLLVEHTENDSYWGDGGDGTGKNMLGKILMEIRNELLKSN
jgi:ribA/ribD-fused uncharacterized protein